MSTSICPAFCMKSCAMVCSVTTQHIPRHHRCPTANNFKHFHALLHKRMDELFNLVKPRKSVVLALDGPAPLAKLITQRYGPHAAQPLQQHTFVCEHLRLHVHPAHRHAPRTSPCIPHTAMHPAHRHASPRRVRRSSTARTEAAKLARPTKGKRRGAGGEESMELPLSSLSLTPGTPVLQEVRLGATGVVFVCVYPFVCVCICISVCAFVCVCICVCVSVFVLKDDPSRRALQSSASLCALVLNTHHTHTLL